MPPPMKNNPQGRPPRMFIIECALQANPGKPLALQYDEKTDRLTVADELPGKDPRQLFQVDVNGYIQNAAQGDAGFVTRGAGPLPTVVGLEANSQEADARQQWNFKAGPERRQGRGALPDQAENELERFTLCVSPWEQDGQTKILQVTGVGQPVQVVLRQPDVSPEKVPLQQAWHFRRVS